MNSSHVRAGITEFYERATSTARHRYRSWEHCYRYFNASGPEAILRDKQLAALHLGFYLASWGMYRGSSFLLQHDYTVHEQVIERLAGAEFSQLWQQQIGAEASDRRLVELILSAVAAVKEAYCPYGEATDTLATKVLLGTLACLPACDRYFIKGFKRSGYQYSYLNERFVERVIGFCTEYGAELSRLQTVIKAAEGAHYPLMKLADMYFWQVGTRA